MRRNFRAKAWGARPCQQKARAEKNLAFLYVGCNFLERTSLEQAVFRHVLSQTSQLRFRPCRVKRKACALPKPREPCRSFSNHSSAALNQGFQFLWKHVGRLGIEAHARTPGGFCRSASSKLLKASGEKFFTPSTGPIFSVLPFQGDCRPFQGAKP